MARKNSPFPCSELYLRMRSRHQLPHLSATLAGLFLAASVFAQDGGFDQETAAWRTQHTADLLKPDGWLSLVGLEWLQPSDNSVGAASDNKIHLSKGPAHLVVLHLEGDNVTLNPPPGGFPQDFLVSGTPAKPQSLRVEGNKDKLAPRMTIGDLSLYVIRRESRFALRIKDAHSPSITGFHGLKWYPSDISFRVLAKWIPYTPYKTITLATLVGTTYDQPVPGVVEFSLAGKTFSLEPVL